MGLKAEQQKPGEATEEYFKRVVDLAVTEQRTVVALIGSVYVDVSPETTVEFLKGFLEGVRAWESIPNNFMGFN